MAITSARRVSELQALSIQEPFLMVNEDRLEFRLDLGYLPKAVSLFHRSQNIAILLLWSILRNYQEQSFHNSDVRSAVLNDCKVPNISTSFSSVLIELCVFLLPFYW